MLTLYCWFISSLPVCGRAAISLVLLCAYFSKLIKICTPEKGAGEGAVWSVVQPGQAGVKSRSPLLTALKMQLGRGGLIRARSVLHHQHHQPKSPPSTTTTRTQEATCVTLLAFNSVNVTATISAFLPSLSTIASVASQEPCEVGQ